MSDIKAGYELELISKIQSNHLKSSVEDVFLNVFLNCV